MRIQRLLTASRVPSILLLLSIVLISNLSPIPSPSLEAQVQNPQSQDRFRTAFAYEQVTLDNTAGGVALTAATYNPTVTDLPSSFTRAELAIINCNNAAARYKVDGVAAVTTSAGMLIQDGDWFTVYGYAHIVAFRGIRTGATSVVCDVTYYRNR